MDSWEAAERARLAETFLFRGAPPEAVELARTDPRTVRQENGKGGVIYAPHAFRRCLGVVLEGRVQVNKGALIMSVLEPGISSARRPCSTTGRTTPPPSPPAHPAVCSSCPRRWWRS